MFTTSWYGCQYPASFDESVFDEKFAAEMREYADAILGGKKTLGVLARGTDYRTANLGADRMHATADQMISVIREWLDEDGYEKIFLATEDKSFLFTFFLWSCIVIDRFDLFWLVLYVFMSLLI